jgi:hypothetical protein
MFKKLSLVLLSFVLSFQICFAERYGTLSNKSSITININKIVDELINNTAQALNVYVNDPSKIKNISKKKLGQKQSAMIESVFAKQANQLKSIVFMKERENILFNINGQKVIVSFQNIIKNELLINGSEFDLTKADSLSYIENFVNNKMNLSVTTSIFDLIIPSAHANIFKVLLVSAIALVVVAYNYEEAEFNEKMSALEKGVNDALAQCDKDLQNIKSVRVNTEISNDTTKFLKFVSKIAEQTWKPRNKEQFDLFSCDHARDVSIKEAPPHLGVGSREYALCDTVTELQNCTEGIMNVISARNLSVNDNESRGDSSKSPYFKFEKSFNNVLPE